MTKRQNSFTAWAGRPFHPVVVPGAGQMLDEHLAVSRRAKRAGGPYRDQADLVAAVRDRSAGMSITQALRHELREMLTASADDPPIVAYRELIASTPALSDYSRRMWLRHEHSLAEAIADDTGAPSDDIACRALARFTLEVRDLIRARENPGQVIDGVFALLEDGWTTVQASSRKRSTKPGRLTPAVTVGRGHP
jgi:hypothetical protein